MHLANSVCFLRCFRWNLPPIIILNDPNLILVIIEEPSDIVRWWCAGRLEVVN